MIADSSAVASPLALHLSHLEASPSGYHSSVVAWLAAPLQIHPEASLSSCVTWPLALLQFLQHASVSHRPSSAPASAQSTSSLIF